MPLALNGKTMTQLEVTQMITVSQLEADKTAFGYPFEFEHVSKRNSRGKPITVRQSGRVKFWKRKPELFMIPVKYGLYENGYIANFNGPYNGTFVSDNAAQWVLKSD